MTTQHVPQPFLPGECRVEGKTVAAGDAEHHAGALGLEGHNQGASAAHAPLHPTALNRIWVSVTNQGLSSQKQDIGYSFFRRR